MEGPSLVIAKEELERFKNIKIKDALGTAKIPIEQIKQAKLVKVSTWGKHLILHFSSLTIRIHFLMFGSYRINQPRENRIAKLEFVYKNDHIYFYSCAIKVLTEDFKSIYDETVDLMSKRWDSKHAVAALKAHPQAEVCDLLLDQGIFSGLGNIMKNEILFRMRMLPQTLVKDLAPARMRALVKESEKYAWQFYDWKKANVLKRNWRVMRKKICPRCENKITKKVTGKLKRLSHYCQHCQRAQ